MTIPRHRTRTLGSFVPEYRQYYRNLCGTWMRGSKWPPSAYSASYEMCDDALHQGPPYKEVGPLGLWKFSCSPPYLGSYHHFSHTLKDCTKNSYEYKGDWYCPPPTTAYSSSIFGHWNDPDWGDAEPYGAVGWNKFKPAKPGADLGVSLAEMRDVWSTIKKRVQSFKNLSVQRPITNPGANFLEANFGWLPLINDVKKAIKQYQSLDDTIDRIRKQNGQWEHRGGIVNKANESWTETKPIGTSISPIFVAPFFVNDPLASQTYQKQTEYSSVTWFSASFKYFIPNINSQKWADGARRKLMGLNLNPSLVWELVPWSWLVDWLSNAGDVFSNMDNPLAENLVAARACVMRHTTFTVSHSGVLRFEAPYGTRQSVPIASFSKWERKHRVAASPFGFGLAWDSFSPKQIAIAAALGLSRT